MALGLLVLLVMTAPMTFWEYDELLFAGAVARFEPLVHHPHPPGYPVFVGLATLVDRGVHDPFLALVTVSIASAIVGFLALAGAFRELLGDGRAAIAGALLFYLSAGMLVHASLPLSDSAAMAFLALTVWRSSRRGTLSASDGVMIGVWASLTIGCRPQLAVMVVPVLALVLLRSSAARPSLALLASFTLVSLAWLLPLVVATGGVSGFLRYQLAQASDFAANDADLARSGWRWSTIALRLVAHPWGTKGLSLPVLASAGVGGLALLGRRDFAAVPLLVSAALYLTFAAIAMDPIDSVRYALPVTMAVAYLAAYGLRALLVPSFGMRGAWAGLACVAIFGVASWRYAAPVIVQRHRAVSPPWEASAYARAHFPPDTIILYERALQPHARQLFDTFEVRPLAEDFGAFADRPEVRLAILADGASDEPDAVTFAWADSDAYGKLTRNHYRVVSLIPVQPASRFRAVRGVYRPERTVAGQHWRWLAPSAELAIPPMGARSVELRLGVPDDYPWDSVDATVRAGDAPPVNVIVRRGTPAVVTLDLKDPASTTNITIGSNRTFVPAEVPALLQHDRRALGVMLRGVTQRP